jgi:phage protein D
VEPEGSHSDDARIELTTLVQHVEYEDTEHVADKVVLTVLNQDLRNFDDPVWRKGNILIISWGYPGDMTPQRRCRIQKVVGFQELKVEAHGLEVQLNTVAKTRTFENVKRSDVARQIAAEFGYRDDDVVHIEDSEITYEHIAQARATDAQFLRRLAAKDGYEWYIDFDGFHFHRRKLAQRPVKVFVYYSEPTQGDILSIRIENDVTRAGTVRVANRDPLERRTIDVKASHEKTNREVLGHVVEAPGTDSKPVPGFKAVAHEITRTTVERDTGAAQRIADGKFLKHQQVAVKMTLECVGDPNILAKSVVELQGIGKRLSGRYYVRTVTHILGAGTAGYKCKLEMVSDGSGGHSTKSTIAEGLGAFNVGPPVKGKRGPDFARRGLDAHHPQELGTEKTTDSEGKPVIKHVDDKGRTSKR